MKYLKDKLISQNYEMFVQTKANKLKIKRLDKLDTLLLNGACSCESPLLSLKFEIKYCLICHKETDSFTIDPRSSN